MRCLFVLDLVISFSFFFPLAAKLISPRTGRQFFKNFDFLDLHPLNATMRIQPIRLYTNGVT